MRSQREPITSIELQDVSFFYEGESSLFENVTLNLSTHHVYQLCTDGQRGSSTLLKVIAGLLTPQQGRYFMNGRDVVEMTFEDFLPLRKSIGFAFQQGGLLNNRSLKDNLELPLMYHNMVSPSEAHNKSQDLLGLFQMQSVQHKRPAMVTAGQRKLIAVLRSLIVAPDFLIMDQPFDGLNVSQKRTLAELIEIRRKNNETKFILFSSQEELSGLIHVTDRLELTNNRVCQYPSEAATAAEAV